VVLVVADCWSDVAVDGLVGAVFAGHFVAAFDAGEVGGGHDATPSKSSTPCASRFTAVSQ
jgi:hypothetical protein